MGTIIYDESENFVDTDEFVDCFNRGCEMQFDYAGKSYSACRIRGKRFVICEAYREETQVIYDTPEAMLEHPIGGKRLRDILQDMKILERTVY